MQNKLKEDHANFMANRQRWKTDFSMASQRADTAFKKIDTTLKECQDHNESNLQAIKMVLDATMINHLIMKQDIEDRKNLLMLGSKNAAVWQDQVEAGKDPGRLSSADRPQCNS